MFLSIYLVIYVVNAQKNSSFYDNSPIIINPSEQKNKNNCTQVRTTCDPKDPNACNNSCNEQELTCVNLQNLNPQNGEQLNGGGAVCLPDVPPSLTCDSSRGGVLVWTGYSEVGAQNWSCLCMYPDRFNGSSCNQTSPGFCTGGSIDTSKLDGSYPDDSLCICPSGTKKMVNTFTNLPFCAPTFLAGNIFQPPDWRNIYFNPSPEVNDNGLAWASQIESELFYPNFLDENSHTTFQKNVSLILSSVSNGDSNTSLSRQYLSLNTANLLAVAASDPTLNLKPTPNLVDYLNKLPINYNEQISQLQKGTYTYYLGAAFAT